ncbi:hypothetical protein [Paratractidigestivibacter sp.]|uniref:hypothetical protein n=1 Tax=Paratractidigestivibacter sp. TaxID=2847316 RepID=UPI002ABD43FA|nr:hypothetical protein [Paratractidigestivibacter sp.]
MMDETRLTPGAVIYPAHNCKRTATVAEVGEDYVVTRRVSQQKPHWPIYSTEAKPFVLAHWEAE